VKGLLKNGASGRDPALRSFLKLSFPENEGAVKGNCPGRRVHARSECRVHLMGVGFGYLFLRFMVRMATWV